MKSAPIFRYNGGQVNCCQKGWTVMNNQSQPDGLKFRIPNVDLELALIYSGCRKPYPQDLIKRISELHQLLQETVEPKSCWKLCRLNFTDQGVELDDGEILLSGSLASKMLAGCSHAVLMAGTLSMNFDGMLHQLQIRNPSDALLFDSLGSSAIENVIDETEAEIRKQMPDYELLQRFSCGYGDLPLELQKDLFRELDLNRRCGIYLSDSLMMNPTKSITAIAGLKETERKDDSEECQKNQTLINRRSEENCQDCSMKENCSFSEAKSED